MVPFGIGGRLWEHFGVTLLALAAYRGNFGATLASVWVSLGSVWVSVADFAPLDESYRSHFGHIKARVKKTFIFLADFNDFIKFMGELCITLGHFGVTFGV